MRYAQHIQLGPTPQSQPIRGRTDQVQNAAGGYVFEVSPFEHLTRFLILGAEKGTFYATEKNLTVKAIDSLDACLAEDAERTVNLIADVSERGRAFRMAPTLFALALVVSKGVAQGAPDEKVIALGWAALPRVVRTMSQLCTFLAYVKQYRGLGGNGVKRAVTRWLDSKRNSGLVYQAFKYNQRDGISVKDVLELVRPTPRDAEQGAIYRYLTRDAKWAEKRENKEDVPEILRPYISARDVSAPLDEIVAEIESGKVSWEMVASEKRSKRFWEIALGKMKPTALIRNLGNLTRYDVLVQGDFERLGLVRQKLLDTVEIRKNRVHPLQYLIALIAYTKGHGKAGHRGEVNRWQPIPEVSKILDDGFDVAWGEVPKIESRVFVGLDISGSMSSYDCAGIEGLKCSAAAALLGSHFAKSAPNSTIMGFDHRMVPLNITGDDKPAAVLSKMGGWAGGRTDCSLPMREALGLHQRSSRVVFDAFVCITDNETWCGPAHATEALAAYRSKVNKNARLAVLAMTPTGHSIADPRDPKQLDLVGMDGSMPSLLNDFVSGAV